MTASVFASTAGRTPAAGTDYRPGVCNIGPAEIRRRRLAGHVGVIAALALLIVLTIINAPPLTRLLVALPAAGAASGYLQAWLKFCAGFGARGIFNFGRLGEAHRVADTEARNRDRSMATRIGLASAAVGLVVGILAVLLAL